MTFNTRALPGCYKTYAIKTHRVNCYIRIIRFMILLMHTKAVLWNVELGSSIQNNSGGEVAMAGVYSKIL